MTDMTQAEANEVLTYLKLSLLSLLPGRENIIRDHEEEGLHPQVLFALHNLTEDPYYVLGAFLDEKILAHQFFSTNLRVRFCLQQLADVKPIQYASLQLSVELRDEAIGKKMDIMMRRLETSLGNTIHPEEVPLNGFRTLWRYVNACAAGVEPTTVWWALDYMAPTKADVDACMLPLRHLLHIQPKNF